SSRRRHTRSDRDWSSDVCSSDLISALEDRVETGALRGRQREILRHAIEHLLTPPRLLLGGGTSAATTTSASATTAALARALRSRSEERRVGKGGRSAQGPHHGAE